MKYKSNFEKVAKELKLKLERIKKDSTGTSPIAKMIALSIILILRN